MGLRAIAMLLLAVLMLAGCARTDGLNISNGQQSQPFRTIATGNTGQDDALVELTPQGISKGKLKVAITVNTHSVDLGQFDLMQITTLEQDDRTLKPVGAPSLSGHHASGLIVFDGIKTATGFTITIKGIPQVEERVFAWQ